MRHFFEEKWGISIHIKKNVFNIYRMGISYIFLSGGAILMLIPFIWMLSTSFKIPHEVFSWPPQWIPNTLHWDNYLQVITRINFPTYAFNTFKIASFVTIGQLVTCSLAGYAFARIRFPGRNFLFLAYLATIMIPGHVVIIPNFIIMRMLGLVDTHMGLTLPFLTSAFGTFLMRQFFLSFPSELEDAAKLDGCSPFSFYWLILLPLSKPILATLGVMTFQWVWNDFQWPLIMISSESKRTLQVGLSYLSSQYYTDWTILMASSVLSLLPIILLFFLAQNYFVQSIRLTGLKG
jgi:multiple sugar transport system permease protein